ncbi:hypothetical protein [Paenibacillus pini]|uniref:hypothetical protein n=1 Tax=Paenibacillus pini TaxID=669461 RepID=UPI00056D8FB3|nr:hypothetical protein [Paenibacillus pini]
MLKLLIAIFHNEGKKQRATALLCIVIIISIAFKTLLDKLPDQLVGVQWIVSPAFHTMNMMLNADHLPRSDVWFSILCTLIYAMVLGCIYLYFVRQKDARN